MIRMEIVSKWNRARRHTLFLLVNLIRADNKFSPASCLIFPISWTWEILFSCHQPKLATTTKKKPFYVKSLIKLKITSVSIYLQIMQTKGYLTNQICCLQKINKLTTKWGSEQKNKGGSKYRNITSGKKKEYRNITQYFGC